MATKELGKSKRKLKTLALALEMDTELEASLYIYNAWINGNYSFSHTIFEDLSTNERKKAVEYITEYINNSNELLIYSVILRCFNG